MLKPENDEYLEEKRKKERRDNVSQQINADYDREREMVSNLIRKATEEKYNKKESN